MEKNDFDIGLGTKAMSINISLSIILF